MAAGRSRPVPGGCGFSPRHRTVHGTQHRDGMRCSQPGQVALWDPSLVTATVSQTLSDAVPSHGLSPSRGSLFPLFLVFPVSPSCCGNATALNLASLGRPIHTQHEGTQPATLLCLSRCCSARSAPSASCWPPDSSMEAPSCRPPRPLHPCLPPAPRAHHSSSMHPTHPPAWAPSPPQTTLSLQSSHSRRLSAFTAQR